MTTSSSSGLPFTRLGQYEILAPISNGGMANVYLGRSETPPRRLAAIKVIRPEYGRNKDFVAMFLDEAKIASRLAHRNIVRIYELGADPKRLYLAMELLYGRTLREIWEGGETRGDLLPFEVSAWIAARIGDALQCVHGIHDEGGAPQQIVHRDVNPGNIFITYDGTPKLIDFGLAKAANRIARTARGVVKGKLAYLSPEQTRGQSADYRSDLFSLGITLWELTVGRRLFREASDIVTVERVAEADVPDPTTLVPGYPEELASIVRGALSRDPDDRPASAGEFARRLDEFIEHSGRVVDDATVATVVRRICEQNGTPAFESSWEKVAHAAAMEVDRPRSRQATIEAWDEDEERITMMRAAFAGTGDPDSDDDLWADIDAVLETQISAHRASGDGSALAKSLLERAIVDEILHDGKHAAAYARAALEAFPRFAAADAIIRRAAYSRTDPTGGLARLDAELASASGDRLRASLTAQKAHILEAANAPPADVEATWAQALAMDGRCAAALKGREAALERSTNPLNIEAFTSHLSAMADAFADAPTLAAWIRVERAELLDAKLGRSDAAAAELRRARELTPGNLGVLRRSTLQAFARGDAVAVVELLVQTATCEPDHARAARLELHAAVIARRALGDAGKAIGLLESARTRATVEASTTFRIDQELIELYEESKLFDRSLTLRKVRIDSANVPSTRRSRMGCAYLARRLGLLDAAIECASLARSDPTDPDFGDAIELIDSVLDTLDRPDDRLALWRAEAERLPSDSLRADAYTRAAHIAGARGDRTAAISHLRAALLAAPQREETMGELMRLLQIEPIAVDRASVEARVALYGHAAQHAAGARRIAHLESIARLQEDVLGDSSAAAKLYDEILDLEPRRTSAILGLARTAAHSRNPAFVARANLLDAASSDDPLRKRDRATAAAAALAATDPGRALGLVLEVLAGDADHGPARALATAIHARAERWGSVGELLREQIAREANPSRRADRLLELADIQENHLGSIRDAIASVEHALALAPGDSFISEKLISLLEKGGDRQALLAMFESLAERAAAASDKSHWLIRAAEISELSLANDEHAVELLTHALAMAPDDSLVQERLVLLHHRIARAARLNRSELRIDLLERLFQSASRLAATNSDIAFEQALLARDVANDVPRAIELLDALVARDPTNAPALRALESLARRTNAPALLANTLALQSRAFTSNVAAVGALWGEVQVVETSLQDGDTLTIYRDICARSRDDYAASSAFLREALRNLHRGEAGASALAIEAMTRFVESAPDDGADWLWQIALGLLAKHGLGGNSPDSLRAALGHFRAALRLAPHSPVAATTTARIGRAVDDKDACLEGAKAQADIATDAMSRARYLVEAATLVLATEAPESRRESAELLSQAIDADADCVPAVSLLVKLHATRDATWLASDVASLVATLQSALRRAQSNAAVVQVAWKLADVLRQTGGDPLLVVNALERLRAADPTHVGGLMLLARNYIAANARAEAAEAFEAAVRAAQDDNSRISALFELAALYAGSETRGADAESALLNVLTVDSANVRAVRALVDRYRADPTRGREFIDYLERAAHLEPILEARGSAFLELAHACARAGDRPRAEQALIEAASCAPSGAMVVQVGAFFGTGDDGHEAHVRALELIVARGDALGKRDAIFLATLAELEIDALDRPESGIAHAQAALALAPHLAETRAALARALAMTAAHDRVVDTLAPMLSHDSRALLALRDPGAALAVFDRSLGALRRSNEQQVVREWRVVAGAADDATQVDLRARRLPQTDGELLALSREELLGALLPVEARLPILEAAAAIRGIEAKLLPISLAQLGIAPRERLSPRSDHPLRAALDRLSRMIGCSAEIVLSDKYPVAVALVQDDVWIVAPRSLESAPEPLLLASLARPLLRAALGLWFYADLGIADTHALLIAIARQAEPTYGDEFVESTVRAKIDDWQRRVGRAIGRKQKKALGDLAESLRQGGPAVGVRDIELLARSTTQAETRFAYAASGDLLAVIDELRAADPTFRTDTGTFGRDALAAVLRHPLAGDVARFATTSDALKLRARIGTLHL